MFLSSVGMLSCRDCPILWMIPCYLYELPPSRYLLFDWICVLCGLCDVSGQCLLTFPLLLSWPVCARGSLWLPSALFPVRSFLVQWALLAAFSTLAFVPISSEADRDWMESVHSTWVCRATHRSSFLQDFWFLSTDSAF